MYLIFKTYFIQSLYGSSAPFLFGNARNHQRQLYVLQNCLMGNEVIALENESYGMVTVGIPIPVVVFLRAPALYYEVAGSVLVKSAYNIQQGGFTAARSAQNGHEFVFAEFEADTLQCVNGFVSYEVIFFNVDKFQHIFLRKK